MPQFLTEYRRVDAKFLCDLLRELVADNPTGHPLDVWQQMLDSFVLTLGAADWELGARPFDQVGKIGLGMTKSFSVGIFALAANIEIRVEARFEGQHLDLKFLFDQQAQGTLGGLRSRSIGIKVHHDVLAEPPEQLGLDLGESGTGAGNHVLETSGVDGDAVHLAFDDDGIFLANPFLGLVEIEKNSPLGIDRRLRRVQILRPGFVVG